MNELSPEVFSSEVWKALYAFLRSKDIEGLEEGASIDGITPSKIETNKNGVSIEAQCWLLRGAGKDEYEFPMQYRLCRPKFNSVESVTPEKINKSKLRLYSLEDGCIYVEME
ncbi:hypothetical protein N9Z14_06570 [Opitutales bacterium]|nr:hypothetical protein [Opitutales bacterium]